MAARQHTHAGVLTVALGLIGVVVMALAVRPATSSVTRPAFVEHDAPKRPSLHAAPAGDAAALNADIVRFLPKALADQLLSDGRPTVVIFLKADCECSKRFAAMASGLAAHLRGFAACTAVIEGTPEEADAFASASRLTIPFIAQPQSGLAREWGVRKAGCFALVGADGGVEAVWPGVSRQGFSDLARRIGVRPLPVTLLSDIPGAATAGCPLECAVVGDEHPTERNR